MANNCWNLLSVTGPVGDVQKFHDACDFKNFPACFIPCPEEVKTMHDKSVTDKERTQIAVKHGVGSWYDFAIKRYSSKWCNFEGQDPQPGDYAFDSTWSPPEEAIRRISLLFPTLTFTLEYDEQGMAFQGKIVYLNGETLDEEYREGDDYICECEWEECHRCNPDTYEEVAAENDKATKAYFEKLKATGQIEKGEN